VPKGTFEDFISVKIFRYFLLVIIKCASFQASKIEPVSLPIDWYVEYHSDSRSLLHDVESGLLTQRHTDVPLERKEKENSTDKNLIAPSTRGPTVDTCPMARRSTRVPWPIPAHTRTFQKEAPRKKLTEPSRPSSAHHEARPHGEPNPEPYPITAVGVTVELDPTAKDHAAGKISVCPGPIGTRGFCRSRFAHGMFFFLSVLPPFSPFFPSLFHFCPPLPPVGV
jgi:hypothetical protein